ncbi:MAG: hypothetical protein ACP5JH_04985 [Bacteroidota bacterium]
MGSKAFPLTRVDRLWFPFFVVMFVVISSLALFARLKLQEANGRVALLHRKLDELKVDISWLGERIPPDLLLLAKKAQNATTNKPKLMVLYFVSPKACEACMEEDIETFKKLHRLNSRASIFFVSPDISWRERATLVHRYQISFPCFFLNYPGENVMLYRVPTTICCDSTGKILMRYASEFGDTSWNRVHGKALIRIIGR